MTQTFADELFNNLSKLKGGYKLDETKIIILECNLKDGDIKTTLYFYGLDYSIGSETNKGNFIIGEKVAEIETNNGLLYFSTEEEATYITLNFEDDKITGFYHSGSSKREIVDDGINKIESKTFYSVSHPYPALFITSTNIDKNSTYSSNLNNAINEINTDILNTGIIYTVPEFVKEE